MSHSSNDHQNQQGDRPFEAMGRLVRAAASVSPSPARERLARASFLEGATGTPERARKNHLLLAAIGVLAVAGVGGTAALLSRAMRTPSPTAATTIDDARRAPLLTGGSVVRFDDGSEVALQPDARARLSELKQVGANVLLEAGTLRVRVTPRPETRWFFQGGPFGVRVTGTAFAVSWDPRAERFEIQMTEGHVTISGPQFQQRLGAGQRLVATTQAGIVSLGEVPPPGETAPPATKPGAATSDAQPPAPRVKLGAASRAAGTTWSRKLGTGEFTRVVAEAEAEGLATVLRLRGADDLSALATAARFARRPDVARRVLASERARFPGSEGGREAAFHLGRLADDVDRDPAAAIEWYDRYLLESPRGALACEAMGRKMQALVRVRGGALGETARTYAARCPGGAHAALAERARGE